MASLSEKAYKLREEYKLKHKEYPRGWCHGEETMKQYENFLQELLKEDNI